MCIVSSCQKAGRRQGDEFTDRNLTKEQALSIESHTRFFRCAREYGDLLVNNTLLTTLATFHTSYIIFRIVENYKKKFKFFIF